MSLGLSVIGWILLALVYVPLSAGFAWLALRRWRGRTALLALIAVVIYVPLVAAVAGAAYVEFRWRALCATAHLEVKRTVVVEGFLDDGFRADGWDVLRNGQHGFRYVEWRDKAGHFWRDEGFNEPTRRRTQIEAPTARYRWTNPEFASPFGHLIERRESTVVDTQTGEVIARSVMGYRYPALVDQLWSRFMGGGPAICGGGDTMSALVGID